MITPSDAGLHGRELELAAALAALDGDIDGGPVVVWIEGEAGIGKTRLVTELARQAATRGWTVRRAAATPFERTRACGPLLEALGCVRTSRDPRRAALAATAAAVRGDLDVLRVTADPVLAHEVREGLLALLTGDAQDDASERLTWPLALVLDDVHWADAATFATLAIATSRLRHRRLALVLTARPATGRAEIDEFLARVEPVLTTVPLGPLAPAAVAALLADVLGGTPTPATVQEFGRAGGNPFLCVTLALGAADAGAVTRHDDHVEVPRRDVPASARDSILRRMAALPPEVVDVLRHAAILGPAFSGEDLARSCGTSAARLTGPLRHGVRAGLLVDGARLQFRHALVREAIYDDLPAAVRSSMHRELALALRDDGGDAAVIAHHAMLGSAPGDEVSADLMVHGAANVVAHDPSFAVVILERAVAVAVALSPVWARAVADLVVALQWAGRVDEAERRCRAALEIAVDPCARVALRVRLAWCRGMRSDFVGALLDMQEAAATPSLPDDVRATLHSEVATLAAWTFQESVAIAEADAAVRLGDTACEHAAAVQARCIQSFLALMRGDVAEAVDLAREAVRRAAPAGAAPLSSPLLYLGLALLFTDDVAGSEAALRAGLAQGERTGDVWIVSRYQAALSVVALFAGPWGQAVELADELLRLADETGIRSGFPQVTAIAGLVSLHRGDLDEARRWLEIARAQGEASGSEPIGFMFLWWLDGLLAREDGDVDRAASSLGMGYDLLGSVAPLVRLFLGPDVIRVALASGDHTRAAHVADDLAEVAGRLGTPTARALAGAARGLADRDPVRLGAAAAEAGRSPYLFLAAQTAADAGRALHQRGQTPAAVPHLALAATLFDRIGAGRHRERVLTIAPATVSPRTDMPAARVALTPAEARVHALVREGLDNTAIAVRLGISKRTVESHLSKLYQKLGVDGRVALSRADGGATAAKVRDQ